MQRYNIIHDGSGQGWQATYLAFHVAARLGAPLQTFIIGSGEDKLTRTQWANQVEISGRAAGVATVSHHLPDLSVDTLRKYMSATDGLFLPAHLIPDREAVARFLEAVSCPLWIVSKVSEIPEINEMAVLVDDPARDLPLINYTKALSHRLQQPLTGLIEESKLLLESESETSTFRWKTFRPPTLAGILPILRELNTDLLFISVSNPSTLDELPCNLVICPEMPNA